jgi:small-conductance mechanosensitive channel
MGNVFEILSKLTAWLGDGTGDLHTIVKLLLAILISMAIWSVFLFILTFVRKRTEKIEFIKLDERFFKIVRSACRYALILLAGTYIIRLFEIQVFEKVFYAIIVVLLAGPLTGLVKIVISFLKKNLAGRTDTNVDDIIFDLLNKFAGFIVYITAIILALDILGINVMPFIAGAGVAGVAVGFAAKDTLSNLIAGVLLLIDRPFEVGDRIEVWSAPAGSASWGDVMDIGLRATKIKTTDNILIIIPNNEIMTRDIVNYTLLDTAIRVRINIGVAYNTDIQKAKKIITGIADGIEWVMDEPAPKVVVRNFGESAVDLQLRVWINNARKRMDTISIITDHVKQEFDAAGVEIPFPRRDVSIIDNRPGK